jgi:hypothetical protein
MLLFASVVFQALFRSNDNNSSWLSGLVRDKCHHSSLHFYPRPLVSIDNWIWQQHNRLQISKRDINFVTKTHKNWAHQLIMMKIVWCMSKGLSNPSWRSVLLLSSASKNLSFLVHFEFCSQPVRTENVDRVSISQKSRSFCSISEPSPAFRCLKLLWILLRKWF